MASTRNSRITSCEIGEIIDYIDLTDETYYHGPESYRDASENLPSSNDSPTTQSYRFSFIEEQATLVSTVLDTVAVTISLTTPNSHTNRRRSRNRNRRQAAASNRNRSNTNADVFEEPEEVNLDNTNSAKSNGPWCINDSCTAEPTTLTCAICLEELRAKCKPTTTCCGHIFCEKCLLQVINEKKKCPTCQSKISKKSCTRLYF